MWTPSPATRRAGAANSRSIYNSTLTALGFSAAIQVGAAVPSPAAADTAPPHVGAVSAAPTSVDVTDAAASVKLIATITDASGICEYCASVGFRSPSGTQSVYASFGRTSGASFEATVNLAKAAQPGKWN